MIKTNKFMCAATLLMYCAAVQAEKYNRCVTFISWVNGKFHLFSTECPDEMISKAKKPKTKNEDTYVQHSNGDSFLGWGSNINISSPNGTFTSNDVVINGDYSTSSAANSVTVSKKPNSITVSNKGKYNTHVDKTIKLTGTKERIPLSEAVDTVSVPSYLAHVTMSDTLDPYIECDTAVLSSNLKFTAEGGGLQPYIKENTSIKFKGTGGKPLCTIIARMLNDSLFVESSSTVKVDTQRAKHVSASGASTIHVDDIVSSLKSVNMQGASNITIPYLDTDTFNATLSSLSTVTVQGRVDQQVVDVSDLSSYEALDLKSDVAKVNVSGASSARLWVNRMLSGWVMNASHVKYRGNAENNVQKGDVSSCKKIRA